jgi:hypothetical protein
MRGRALIFSICGAMLGVFLLPAGASAHDLKASSALGALTPYVSRVLSDPQRGYTNALKSCRRGGGGHLQDCTVSYDNAQTRADEAARQAAWVCPVPPRTPCGPRRPKRLAPWACVESLQAYHKAHTGIGPFGGRSLNVHLKHTRGQCGPTRLLGR